MYDNLELLIGWSFYTYYKTNVKYCPFFLFNNVIKYKLTIA